MRLPISKVLFASLLVSGAGFAEDAVKPAAKTPNNSEDGLITPGEPRNPEEYPAELPSVNVVATTPLASTGTELKKVPGNFQTANSEDLYKQESLSLGNFMFRNLQSVNITEAQSNPFQPDVSYRGFMASHLTGTPVGLSVFQDGVRVNEAFGDTVNWDLIPRFAIDRIELVPGSNPLFGLNTLGGALTVRTKNGFTHQGTRFQAEGGSFDRHSAELTHGGSYGNFDWFVGGNLFEEEGWRNYSRSTVKQGFMKVGWDNEKTDIDLSYTFAENSLTGNGAAPADTLAQNWSAVYVHPETTTPRVNFVTFKLKHAFTKDLEFTGNAYYRKMETGLYAADAAVEDNTSGPGFVQDLAINRSYTKSDSTGGSGQLAYLGKLAGFENNAVIGFDYTNGNTRFTQSKQDGTVNPAFGVDPDPTVEVSPRTNLKTENTYYGAFFTDTFSPTSWLHLTGSGRWNMADVNLNGWGTYKVGDDHIQTSLAGNNSFSRFNPAGGFTLQPLDALGINAPADALTAYSNYSEGFRVPSPAELACANPSIPCALPTNFTSDPPLNPVVSHTYEVGFRGRAFGDVKWNTAWYRIDVDNEILYNNVSNTQGYFKNVAGTRREGLEAGLSGTWQQLGWFANYTITDATYQADAQLQNPIGPVAVRAGDRMPNVPSQLVKAGFDYEVLKDWRFGADMQYVGSQQYLHDNAQAYPNVPEYVVLNLNTRYKPLKYLELFAMVRNVTDNHYFNYGLANRTAFSTPNVGDVKTFLSPGAPIGAWAGFRLMF